ncbi:MAG: acylphosphatase [Treponema sp.]|nr:acylphosphatase [Treponema sp.]
MYSSVKSLSPSVPDISAFFARVKGRVQGVGFRYACLHEARLLSLSGWVRNTHDGDVEVWAEGSGEKLETFLLWLHHGPPGACVDTVDYNPRSAAGDGKDFRVVY